MPGALNQGVLGTAAVPYLVWIGHRLALQEPVVIHENVVTFPVEHLSKWLAPFYIIMTLVMNLEVLGWPQRRPRRITVCVHKGKVIMRLPWTPDFVHRFHRQCLITFQAFMTAPEHEQATELRWANSRALKAKTPRVGQDPRYRSDFDVVQHRFVQALHPSELEFLRVYRSRWPGCAYVLNQDPSSGCGMHSTATTLMTQIKNQGPVFVDASNRWMTPLEMISLQGFPVRQDMAMYPKNITPFQQWNPRRRREVLLEQAGNAMPVLLISIPMLFALCCTSLGDVPEPERPLPAPVADDDQEEPVVEMGTAVLEHAPPPGLRRMLQVTYSCESIPEAESEAAKRRRRLISKQVHAAS